MKNKELFTLNPEQVNLKNEGVAKIRTINENEDLSIVEYELKTFVCEGEYHDGFSALVNYHKLNKDNLSKLIYTYLGDWIRMCEAKKKTGESGAEGLLSAALKLKEKLEDILQGEIPYDIFVRWKPIEQQPIGWEPDLNDGVRLNIRPFVEAGVLRSKFNIKWGIDRGKNPKGSYWGEVRNNDRHLSLEEKRVAREIKK